MLDAKEISQTPLLPSSWYRFLIHHHTRINRWLFPPRECRALVSIMYNPLMAPLARTNRYLRDPKKRRQLVTDSVRQSSVFEGARNLKTASPQANSSKRRSIPSAKKSAKKS